MASNTINLNPSEARNNLTNAASFLNTAVSTEMALRAIYNVYSLAHNPASFVLKEALSVNLGGSILFGLCASNSIPGLSAAGASLFTLFSLCVGDSQDAYLISKGIYKFAEHVVQPFFDYVLEPLLNKITDVVMVIFEMIAIPYHPVWLGIALLGIAILTVKYVFPQVSNFYQARVKPEIAHQNEK